MSETGGEANESTTDGSGQADEAGTENSTSGTTSAAGDQFKPITSQQDLEAALKVRLDRERAKFKDYPDLKAKADKFDQVTAAQKSELQLAIERAEAAEQKSTTLETQQQIAGWKSDVAKDPRYAGVTADVLRGSTLEEIEEHAASLKALLPEPRKAGQVPAEGRTVTKDKGDPQQEFAQILRTAMGV